ncbi:hypothetical protein JDV02_001702 [Purpureocillium takamizusanense]|uniref:Uncharacterized protein n=1 Tax=Purpureocillium takamizusanense TaxID=2060973 RepID=A0A9Q8V6X4_9HYPO|nr:uncharacterized protein JDV02_001702 [Purpureocillium takamizusanense]UNI15138.1 hypothetical protein JDV02_001702 [Purpureocillium takamizusanense]
MEFPPRGGTKQCLGDGRTCAWHSWRLDGADCQPPAGILGYGFMVPAAQRPPLPPQQNQPLPPQQNQPRPPQQNQPCWPPQQHQPWPPQQPPPQPPPQPPSRIERTHIKHGWVEYTRFKGDALEVICDPNGNWISLRRPHGRPGPPPPGSAPPGPPPGAQRY